MKNFLIVDEYSHLQNIWKKILKLCSQIAITLNVFEVFYIKSWLHTKTELKNWLLHDFLKKWARLIWQMMTQTPLFIRINAINFLIG